MTAPPKLYLCDTNVIVRYLLGETTPQGKEASDLFERTLSGQVKVIIMEAVFVETMFVLSKVYHVPRSELGQTMVHFLQYKGIINDAKTIWIQALNLYAKSNFHIVDCLLAATSKHHKVNLMTFDQHLSKLTSS